MADAPDPAPELKKAKAEPAAPPRRLLATPDFLTIFQVGDLEFTHVGLDVPASEADDLVTVAARHGVRLVDITPADKD